MAKKKVDTIVRCTYCNSDKIFTEFYQDNSLMFKQHGVYPICKKCISKIYEGLIEAYEDIYIALIHLCVMLNIPFYDDMAHRLISTDNPIMSVDDYIHSVIKQQPRKGYPLVNMETINNIKDYIIKKKEKEEEINENFKITDDMKLRWGDNYDNKDIKFLERIYNGLIESYGGQQMTARSLYCDYAQNELQKQKAREQGKDDVVIKYQNAQSKLMADARLKPVQEQKTDDEDFLVGLFIKNVEETQPIPEADESFKDVDGIRKIINDEYINTLKRSIGGVLK